MKISILMALYNGEKFLAAQLSSIKEQTLLPNQIIFIDDASSINPSYLIKEALAGSGIEYVILKNDRNRGSNYSFRRGVAYASGDVMLFSDQDDIWLNDKIENVKNFFNRQKNASVVFNDCRFLIDEKAVLFPTKADVILSYSGSIDHFVAGCCTAFTKDVAKAVNSGLYGNLNYDDQVHAVGKLLKSRYFLNKSLQLYRRHGNNQSVIPQNLPITNTNGLRKILTRFMYIFMNYTHMGLFNMSNDELEVHTKNCVALSNEKAGPYYDESVVAVMIKLLRKRSYYEFLLRGCKKDVSITISIGILCGYVYQALRGMLR